jgi:GNAT superfamily N-acetyltransferase
MIDADVKLVTKSGTACSQAEFGAYVAYVRAGGEVSLQGLGDRIREAPVLAFAYISGLLVGIAALKNPRVSYRSRISKGIGFPLPISAFPFELGWVYVSPEARRQGISASLLQAVLAAHSANGVFATTRTDNEPMQRSLNKLGFAAVGSAYLSGRGKHSLQVFVRHAAQQFNQADR